MNLKKTTNPVTNFSNQTHLVIFFHGLNKTSSSLKGLEKFIKSQGFSTLNVNYPSKKYTIEELIHTKISNHFNEYKIISFVGFSMGGLIIRAYLSRYKILNLGKVIMIGTPNNGSEVADFFKITSYIEDFSDLQLAN
ncbi:esterase/lipase family protein [Candidatus Cardinium hertigii]|uniref:esterase/lipase family protein n=1 Tax=Candidatus Cardinium hertigii TaxID=247481 RepID=UPI003D7CEA13